MSLQDGGGLLPEEAVPQGPRQKHQHLLTLPSRSVFHVILSVTQASPGSLWAGTTRGHKYQEAKPTGYHNLCVQVCKKEGDFF